MNDVRNERSPIVAGGAQPDRRSGEHRTEWSRASTAAPLYPLSAIVGQEELVEALLINAVAPEVGGVLVRGQRGTAKSTAVRALAPLLPPVEAAADQPFAFAPGERSPRGAVPADAPIAQRPGALVELPLGTTLDRLVGSLDLERALAGERAFEAGLLARAHRGILYVDEVNLLPDHLVDALLDAAASGIARVEREAVSLEHDASFLLVGTMNVEEGELRPQLLDRFGLGVEVRTPTDPAVRAEIVRRRLAFEADPEAFAQRWSQPEADLAARIADARVLIPAVELGERELLRITGACAKLGVDGLRGDIVWAMAARALAALERSAVVTEDQLRRAGALALAHRRRRDPLEGREPDPAEIEQALGDPDGPEPEPPPGGGSPPPGGGDGAPSSPDGACEAATDPRAPARERRDPPVPARLPTDAFALDRRGRGPHTGAIDTRPARAEPEDIAIVATLRSGELREHLRRGREAALVCLVVDASGSMGARRRLARVKGALLGLLRDAYARRDRVAVIAFRDAAAELIVVPGAPLERAATALRELPTGGRTPLAAGLVEAERVIRREAQREAERRSVAVVLTDGRTVDRDGAVRRAGRRLGLAADAVHVVDTEEGRVRLGLASEIAAAAGGSVHRLVGEPRRRAA